MYTIIPLLLAHIQELNKQILFLFNFIIKYIPLKFKDKDDSLFSPKYNKLKVDKLPKLVINEKLDYKVLLDQYLKEHDKPLEEYKTNPEKFKLHYLYREFKINFFKVDLYSMPQNASSLQFRKFSPA